MTAADLHTAALAAIAARRELIAAGTPGRWEADRDELPFIYDAATGGACFNADPNGARNAEADAALIVAAVNAFAADTDTLEQVLLRHAPTHLDYNCDHADCLACCGGCDDNPDYPCPDARAALTALGVPHE